MRAVNGRKLCSRCALIKPVSAFWARKTSKDGYRYWCKECDLEVLGTNWNGRYKPGLEPEYKPCVDARRRIEEMRDQKQQDA